NYALQPMSQEEFVAVVTADQPEAPPYFATDVALNRSERPTLERSLQRALRGLSVDEALEAQRQGGQILDVRDPADYAGAHMAGSVNIGLGGDFAPWAGSVLDMDRPVVIIGDLGAEEEAVVRLGRIGFDRVAGFVEGGMQALDGRPDLLRRTQRITPATLAEQLSAAHPPLVLDVRSDGEHRQARIAGSNNIPLGQLNRRMGELPRGRDMEVHCAGGYRSSVAASLLEQQRFTRVSDLVGGLAAWQAAGLATEG
ncbi:MAG: rhodanese-like domain-containing protein, partial [Dehalococcoidia bacterium]